MKKCYQKHTNEILAVCITGLTIWGICTLCTRMGCVPVPVLW